MRARHIGKSFGDKVVLRDIDVTIHAGEIVAIVGGSGSGKTVFLDTLIGLIPPTSGRILAADHNAPPSPPAPSSPGASGAAAKEGAPPLVDIATLDSDALDLLRLHWAVVFQRNALFSGTVRENISLWLLEHTTLEPPEIDRRVRESLAAVALDVNDVIDKDRDALSGGMAKRVAIARAIACDPVVMFYDEPTTGLDPVIGATVHELIWNLHHRPLGEGLPLRDPPEGATPFRAGARRTTILVTHDRDLLRRLSPRVIMLHDTRVVFDGPYERFGTPGPDGGGEPARAYLHYMPVLHEREPPR